MIETIAEGGLPAHMRALVDFWRAKSAGRKWPNRRELLFEELVPWIGRLHLIDVLDGDFRFAIFGTATTGVLRREYTGMKLSEIPDPLARIWEESYRFAVDRREPLFFHHPLGHYGETNEHVGWWRVILPLGSGDTIENLLVLIQIYRPDGTFI